VCNHEARDLYVTLPGVFETFDTVRREHQIEVERAVLELHEILAALDLRLLRIGETKAQIAERGDDRAAVCRRRLYKHISILRGVGKAKKDRARLPYEVSHAVAIKCVANLLSLSILKRGHTPTNRADSPRTIDDNQRSNPMSGTARHPSPVCTS